MSNTALQKAMDNAEASINMEGLHVSELCEKLLKKEITFEEYIKYITDTCRQQTSEEILRLCVPIVGES